MVTNTRGTPDTRRIRRLKPPKPLEVAEDDARQPERLRLDGGWLSVDLIRRPWRIDQHWWRAPSVSRIYYRVAPEDGPPLTLYRDLVSGEWFRQEY